MLHAQGCGPREMPTAIGNRATIGRVIGAPVLLWQVIEPREMANRVEYLRASDRHVLAPDRDDIIAVKGLRSRPRTLGKNDFTLQDGGRPLAPRGLDYLEGSVCDDHP